MNLALLWVAEINKLLSRTSARLGLFASGLLSILGAFVLAWMAGSEVEVNGLGATDVLGNHYGPYGAAVWGLAARQFTLVHYGALIVCATASVAGEFGAKTLREDLLRPVARWEVLIAKWLSLCAWSALALFLTVIGSQLTVLVSIGPQSAPWSDLVQLYALVYASDCCLAALVVLCGVMTRSVALSVGAMMAFVACNFIVWAGIKALRPVLSFVLGLPDWVTQLLELEPYLPSAALAAWLTPMFSNDVLWQNVVALMAYTVGGLVVAVLWFERSDVP